MEHIINLSCGKANKRDKINQIEKSIYQLWNFQL